MTSPIQTSDAWIRARDRYVQDLSEKEQQMYFNASPESLLDDASAADKSHGTKSTTRRVMEKLQPLVAAIEQYGEAIDVYSNTYPLALGPIWGSIKVLLHIAREFGKYFDKLVDMFARIGDVLPRFRTYERLFSNHERLIEALSVAYLDIILFCFKAKAVFRKATLKMTLKLLWKPFDVQFGQQLGGFREHQKNVEKEAGLADMIEAADARAMMLANQKQLEKQRREDHQLRIIAMLHAIDYEAKHRKLQSLRHTGTGEWLFQEAAYIHWKTPGNSAFLCCRGIPGCGKSILASNLVDSLMGVAPVPTLPVSDVIYYYCDYADLRTLQLDRILGSLLKQLLLGHQIPEHIESKLLHIYSGGIRSPAEEALGDIFCSIVALRSNICIIFDGIDECEKSVWRNMIKIFKHLATMDQCGVKIFLTCVEEGSVAHHFHDAPCVQLSPAATAEDIRAFVTSSVRSKIDDGELRTRNPELEQDIISQLSLRANGMFLWVFFQLDDLCDSSSDAAIRETLNNLPEGLGDTYRRILTKISKSPSRAQMAKNVFRWATVAKRPLQVEELKEAVAFEPDDKSWNADKIPHEDFMFESCRGLIIKDEDDDAVHFAHHTVRQYLTGGLTTKVDPLFEVSVVTADITAGQICVAYLSFSDFETQITSTTPTARLEQKGVLESGGPLQIPSILGIRRPMFDIPYRLRRGDPALRPSDTDYWKHLRPTPKPKVNPSTDLKDKYRLLCYAIEYWEPHTRWYYLSDSFYRRRLKSFAMHKTLAFEFRPWGSNQHFGPYGCIGCPSPSAGDLVAKDLPHISMMHYAAEVGNLMLLQFHHSYKTWIADYMHHERHHHETLLIACRHNRIDVVTYLIQFEEYDISDGRAVNAAATAGQVEVLEYLLSLGQYPTKQQGDVPLLLAAKNGHEAAIRVLIEAGADVDERSIIESAAMNGHDSVILALAHGGAGSSFTGPDPGSTALHLAAANGHAAAIEVLLEYVFSKDKEGVIGRTARQRAAESGQTAVAEALHNFVDSPSRDGIENSRAWAYDETPFHLAAKGGHVKVLAIFNKYVRSVDSPQTSSWQTALHFAASGGHDKAIRWLVENGADVNAIDSDGQSPLQCALIIGSETAVYVLLELGARFGVAAVAESSLRLSLESIRDSQQMGYESKRQAILRLSRVVELEQMFAARELR